ncbi:hypothetical protein [Ideonella paludis]|uniref:hypothetical protein n=1 Tax=Ideonella paludis TaxID=1233411 RepID=UPI00363B1AC3
MGPALAALIVHDLKNGLGALEAELLALQHTHGEAVGGATYKHCVELRQRFVQFLALYGVDGTMRAHSADESPQDLIRLICKEQGPLLAPLTLQAGEADQAPLLVLRPTSGAPGIRGRAAQRTALCPQCHPPLRPRP